MKLKYTLAKVEIGGHGGEGVKKCHNFVDVIYGWPLSCQ